MRKLNMLLGLVLAPLALAGCATAHPLARMGPQSARYITSRYRQSFQEALVSAPHATERAASVTSAEAPWDAGHDVDERATDVVRAASSLDESEFEIELEEGARTPAAAVAKRSLTPPPRSAVRPPVPAPRAAPRAASIAHAAAAAAADAAQGVEKPAGLPEPLRWAKRDYEKLGSHTPAPPVTQRRFVRLRLTELDGSPVQAREARPVLRAIVGVQDAVLNETTGTAVVVVDPNMEASTVIDRLAGRYRATIVR